MALNKISFSDPRTSFAFAKLVTALIDFLSFLALATYALLVGPLLALRGPMALPKIYAYLWVLLPKGAITPCLRGLIDWRLGNFEGAIAQIESVVGLLGTHISRKNPRLRFTRDVAEDLYTLLVRAYLHTGHLDEAMLVILRAKKVLGVNRLRQMPDLDVKTAHLVRAGLAAGKLLEGDAVATLFVKSNDPERSNPSHHKEKPKTPIERYGNLFKDKNDSKETQKSLNQNDLSRNASKEGKVIPFPFKQNAAHPPPEPTLN